MLPQKGLNVDPSNWQKFFREASWDEALDSAADGLKNLRITKVGLRLLVSVVQSVLTRRLICSKNLSVRLWAQ